MSNGTNIYRIRDIKMLESHPPRLVKATSKQAALRFVHDQFEASLPSAEEVLDLVTTKGIVVETAA